MSDTTTLVEEPRTEAPGELHVAGQSCRYAFADAGGIPMQWQNFAPLIPAINPDPDAATFGVIHNSDGEHFDYLASVELAAGASTPSDADSLTLAPQTYLVFWHPGHVATLHATCDAIWNQWLPASSYQAAQAPWFERYGAEFEPTTGAGGVEVWIPVVA